jgi:hypothetical protein
MLSKDEDGDMEDVLLASAPREDLAEHLALFAPLIGSWSLEVDDIEPDGTVHTRDGEWHFDWALDGRAVVDVWISPARATRAAEGVDGEWGMTVRFYDPDLGAFRSTWHGPGRGWVIPFVGHSTPDGMRLDGERDGVPVRWTFSELSAERFRWQAEEGGPGGAGMRVRQRFRARRKR